MTIKDVAEHLGIGWDAIKDIQKRHLQSVSRSPSSSICDCWPSTRSPSAKDIATSRWCSISKAAPSSLVGDGKGADALDPFWRRLRPSGAKIEAVALDMSKAYILAVTENLPEAALVFDRFHVVKLFNDRLADFRRELQRGGRGKDCARTCSKGRLAAPEENPENLDPKRRERERLEESCLRINQPLAAACYMKEDSAADLGAPRPDKERRPLGSWPIGSVAPDASGIKKILHKMAATLEAHRYGILAYYDHSISTGPLEGTNNKIKTLQRQAYGFRDHEFFKLKIYALP